MSENGNIWPKNANFRHILRKFFKNPAPKTQKYKIFRKWTLLKIGQKKLEVTKSVCKQHNKILNISEIITKRNSSC